MPATFLTNPFRSKLSKTMKSKPVLAAVAYVSEVVDLPMGPGDMLVCDASDEVARSGGTTRDALNKLVKAGVAVWSLPGMHAKVVVCGDRAIVGSANWSATAENRKVEAGVEVDDPEAVAAAKAFVQGLPERGAVKVDKGFLKRMPKAVPREGDGVPARQANTEVSYWLISGGDLPEGKEWEVADDKLKATETEDDGASKFKSDEGALWFIFKETKPVVGEIAGGDMMTLTWNPGGIKVKVFPPRRVLRTAAIPGYIGILTQPPEDEENRGVPWAKFQKAAIKAGVRKNITERSSLRLGSAAYKELAALW